MRTTIELKPEHRAKLLELAARRGERGTSSVIAEAIEAHLKDAADGERTRRRAIQLRGRLSRKNVDTLRRTSTSLRESWR